MRRAFILSICCILAEAPLATAQDISLSQILIDGEGWKIPGRGDLHLPPTAGLKSGAVYLLLDHKLSGITAGGDELKVTLPEQLSKPSALVFWPDQGTLVVGSENGKHLWAFRVEKDGSLSAPEQYYALQVAPGKKECPVIALAVDTKGMIYAATPLGVQVFDPTGRLSGVISKPATADITGMLLGQDGQLLVSAGGNLYSRMIRGKGVPPAAPMPK